MLKVVFIIFDWRIRLDTWLKIIKFEFNCIYIVKFLIRFTIEFDVNVKLLNNLTFFSKLFLIETDVDTSSFSLTLNDRDEDLIIDLDKKMSLRTDSFTTMYITLILFRMFVFRISIQY